MKMSATPLFDPTDASSVSHEPRAHRADVTVPAADAAPPAAATLVTELPQTLVTGSYTPGSGVLAILGDGAANTLTVSRDAAGQLLVNGGAIAVAGGTPTVANTARIQVFGLAGNDVIALDESNGALPAADLFGGNGNDTLTGGSGADLLFGQAGNDTLDGKGGNDLLFGGAGNDVLTGGDGEDQLFGEAGDDRIVWNPGDDSDLAEGGDGIDTLQVNGGNGAETFTLTANGTRFRFDRLDPAPFFIDAGTIEKAVVNLNGGDDHFSATGNLAALVQVTVDGGAGNDTLLGSNGADTLMGGDGNDFIDGQQGNDTILLGAGDDTFQWDAGDGSDIVEGGTGTDAMLFNGTAIGEVIDISANGGRVRFTRNIASIAMDLNDVERIQLRALGGNDVLTIGDLSGTDLKQIDVDLAGTFGGSAGDATADTILVTGRAGNDNVTIAGNADAYAITGLPATINVSHADAQDPLVVYGGAGNDVLNASALAGIRVVLDGGDGNDTLTGGTGNDTLYGGLGNDTMVWNAGGGNDVVEGQDGADTLRINGNDAAERYDIAASGARVNLFRDIGAALVDAGEVETIDLRTGAGADAVTVGDLAGTGATQLRVDLGSDTAADTVTVNGSQAGDAITVRSTGSETLVSGLAAEVHVTGAVLADDRLIVNGQAGDDVIDASAMNGRMALTINGGLGIDRMIGSARGDLFVGGDGNDVALMGAGDDTFVWNPGDDNDIVEGQAGNDTLQFNGANIAETINIAANGGRVLFTRNIASVTMDLDDVETLRYNALGGADAIGVHDLSATDVTAVQIDLAGTVGGSAPDGAADTVTIDGTDGDDVIQLSLVNGALVVDGLAARVVIDHFDPALDTVRILGLGGDDVIDASALPAGMSPRIEFDGGSGDDVLLGSPGGSTLLGGDGDDVLIGGPGNDWIDGGTGADILIGGGGTDVILDSLVQTTQPVHTGLFAA